MILFPCPYLGSDVEFSDERIAHVSSRHPDCCLRILIS
jgi:hypothetical protein